MSAAFPLPALVAHRGARADYPENTLLAVEAAIAAGAVAVEIDIQLSADRIPFVIHDPVLMRTTGRRGCVARMPASTLETISAHEPQRFGQSYFPQYIPRLARLVDRLNRRPPQRLFVEIKQHALRAAGIEATLAAVQADLAHAEFECVLISFDAAAIEALDGRPRGWVVPVWNPQARVRAQAMAPDYLFIKHTRIGADAFWPGNWRWVVYELGQWAGIREWLQRGADLVETDALLRLAGEAGCGVVSSE